MKTLKEIGTEPIRINSAGCFPRLMDGCYRVALGNGRQYEISIQRVGPTLFVGVMGQGFWKFTSYVHASYAAEKLKLGLSDASLIANFINDQLPTPELDRQGLNFIEADLHRVWFQNDYPVEIRQSAVVSDVDSEVVLLSVSATSESGVTLLAEAVVVEALKLAVWGAEKLFNESVAPAPKLFGDIMMVGGAKAITTQEQSISNAFTKRHEARVKAALPVSL